MKKYTMKTRHALLMSLISLMTCFAMLLGTTFAWFTDSVTSGVNRIVAGNLDVEVYHKTSGTANPEEKIDGTTKLFTKDINGKDLLWEPEVIAYESFDVRNVGSLALKYALQLNNVGYNYVDGTGKWLGEVIKVAITDTAPADRAAAQALFSASRPTLATFVSSAADFTGVNADGKLEPAAAGDTTPYTNDAFTIVLYWPQSSADNSWNLGNINGTEVKSSDGNPLYVNLGITLVATQVEHEADSFDNTYDAGSSYPAVTGMVSTATSTPVTLTKTGTETVNSATVSTTTTPLGTGKTTVKLTESGTGSALADEASATAGNTISKDVTLETTTTDTLASSATYEVDNTAGTAVASVDLTLTVTKTEKDSQGLVVGDPVTNTVTSGFTAEVETYIAKNLAYPVTIKYGTTETWVANNNTSELTLPSGGNSGVAKYDSTTGKLTFMTSHFSDYVVYSDIGVLNATTNAAYATLTAANTAAAAGDTLVVMKNLKSETGFVVNKSLNIDTNGKTITFPETNLTQEVIDATSSRAFKLTSGTLRVYGGGTIDAKGHPTGDSGTDGVGYYGAFRAEVGTTLDLDDLTLKNYRPWGLNVKVLGATATLDNVRIVSQYGGGIEVTDEQGGEKVHKATGFATLTNCTMTQSGFRDWCSVPVSVSGDSVVNAYSTTYTGEYGAYVFSSGGTINIYGGLWSSNDGHEVLKTSYDGTNYGYDATINVYDGNIVGTFDIGNSGHEHLNITGGTFDHDPNPYVADGYIGVPNETYTSWTVHETWNKYANVSGLTINEESKTITVTTAAGLAYFNANAAEYANYTVTLQNDINLTGHIWTPIKGVSGITFDGSNHTISNMTAASLNGRDVALFHSIYGSTVKNLVIDNATAIGINHISGIVAYHNSGVVDNCTVKNSTFTACVYKNDDGDKVAAISGLFIGEPSAGMKNCKVQNVTLTGYRDIGSLAGYVGCYGNEFNVQSTPETCYITNNTVSNVTINNVKTPNYKNYSGDNQYDVNELVGDSTSTNWSDTYRTYSGNTCTNVTINRIV